MKISISLPDDLVAAIDKERGLVSRSAYIADRLSVDQPATVKDVFRQAMPPGYSRAESFHRATQR